jgi:hypothetical protein
LAFERENWEADQQRLEEDFTLRERELSLKENDDRRSRWWNPLAIAIIGPAIAAAGSAFVSWQARRGIVREPCRDGLNRGLTRRQSVSLASHHKHHCIHK